MFKLSRNGNRVSINGSVWIQTDWMPKGEWYSPYQVGIFNILINYGWNLFNPCQKGHISLDPFTAYCNSEEIAIETERILKERISKWSVNYSEPE